MEGTRVMTIYEMAVAKMPGERLADGNKTDAGLEKIRTYLNNAIDIKPEEYALPKATTKLTWLRDTTDLLDPMKNPCGFRICQHVPVERGAISPLLGLAQNAQSDGVVMKSLELLARTAFGNAETAAAVAKNDCFLPTIHAVLASGKQPAKLGALQLAQAIAASCGAHEAKEVLPKILAEVIPLLADDAFAVLPQATFDCVVSISFATPAAIVDMVSWADIASWLAENTELGRPAWLDKENLTVLACGFLAANVLSLPSPGLTGVDVDELQARQQMRERLGAGPFLEFFVLAMEAAVAQREWPAHSGAFHSVSRLASVASILAHLGFRRQLAGAVAPLAKAVEINPDERTTRLALLALRSLVEDLSCLEVFLALDEFRSETLEHLHQSGDELEATDLLSCTTAGENALAVGQASLEDSRSALKRPPSVKFLAELFNDQLPMDGELTMEQLLQILPKVPIGPIKDVQASLSGHKTATFGFGAFTQHIYGTPTLLGWWPSLMEDVNSMWNASAMQEVHPPTVCDLLFHYELGAKGASGVTSDAILHVVLPAWGQPVDGELVEDLFAEIRGDDPLNFKEFAAWMCRYFHAVDGQRKQAEKAEAADEP